VSKVRSDVRLWAIPKPGPRTRMPQFHGSNSVSSIDSACRPLLVAMPLLVARRVLSLSQLDNWCARQQAPVAWRAIASEATCARMRLFLPFQNKAYTSILSTCDVQFGM
jgi:hypothetical protein